MAKPKETLPAVFKTGDVVTLKSGGCLMTVIRAGECTSLQEIELAYSRANKHGRRIVTRTFDASMLRLANEDEIANANRVDEFPF